MSATTCAVIGGGVIGLTAAWRLAEAGVSVTVLDPAPGRGASWAAAGMLAPVTELHYPEEALLHLNLAAAAVWPDHAAGLAEAGADVGFQTCGSLMVARDADDAAELRRLMAAQKRLGVQVRWLRSREARQLEPGLAPSTRGGILVPGDHQVDNRALVDGLVAICEAHPAVEIRRASAVAVEDVGGSDVVRLDDTTTVRTSWVVLAAGARTGDLIGLDGMAPIRPVKGQLLHLRSADGPLAERTLRGEDCYIVSRPDGRIVVGATMEEQGFDARPTAGGVRALLDAAWEILPGISEATFEEVAVGFRPGTSDSAPLLGPLPGRPHVLVAAGHHRNGVLQSRLTADAVTAWVTGEDVPDVVTAFPPTRSVAQRSATRSELVVEAAS